MEGAQWLEEGPRRLDILVLPTCPWKAGFSCRCVPSLGPNGLYLWGSLGKMEAGLKGGAPVIPQSIIEGEEGRIP